MISKTEPEPTIIDIREETTSDSIRDLVVQGLTSEPRTLPALLFYSTEGIQHWNHHSHQPDFYPRHEETQILRDHAESIADTIAPNSIIVDLGSATLDKTLHLLLALESQHKPTDYYALDLSASELSTSLQTLQSAKKFQYVRCAALHGTFDDGLRWLRDTPGIREQPQHLLLFGLTLGNFSRPNAAAFVRRIAEHALTGRPSESSLVLTLDSCRVPVRVLRAYTSEGVVPFARAALGFANRMFLGEKEEEEEEEEEEEGDVGAGKGKGRVFEPMEWEYLSEWNHGLGRHEASLIPGPAEVTLGKPLEEITVRRGEKVRFGCSYKYDSAEREALWEAAGVECVDAWSNPGCDVAFYQVKTNA
ncbi:4-dimethylallyltryptophan methyltransferase easF, partial [Aspergillus homomorphus CBS 101889]